jgi:hypothetical protein
LFYKNTGGKWISLKLKTRFRDEKEKQSKREIIAKFSHKYF